MSNEGARPKSLSFREVAAEPVAASTDLLFLSDEAGIQAGDEVCINGVAGGVGSMLDKIAKMFGANVLAVSRTL